VGFGNGILYNSDDLRAHKVRMGSLNALCFCALAGRRGTAEVIRIEVYPQIRVGEPDACCDYGKQMTVLCFQVTSVSCRMGDLSVKNESLPLLA
jgi:hypothetical protein